MRQRTLALIVGCLPFFPGHALRIAHAAKGRKPAEPKARQIYLAAISSGVGSLLSMILGHDRRGIGSRADAAHRLPTDIRRTSSAESGEPRKRLEGKVALITGGSSGIGRATALAFARAGAQVVIANCGVQAGEETRRMIHEAGGTAIFVKTDVAKAAEVRALVERAVDTYGRLDCAFNNAGISGTIAPVAEQTEADFDRTMSVNLKGVWLCMKYEIQQMLTQGGGAIVNMASIYGLTGAPHASLYCASKHGVLGLTKSAALEYARAGIRINAVCAGPCRTPMLERAFQGVPGGNPGEAQARCAEQIPAGRIGEPEESAAAVVWLCSEEASYVTGHSMLVDGGFLAR